MKNHLALYAVVSILILIFGSVTTLNERNCVENGNQPLMKKLLDFFGFGATKKCVSEKNEAAAENKVVNETLKLTKVVERPSSENSRIVYDKTSESKTSKPEVVRLPTGNIILSSSLSKGFLPTRPNEKSNETCNDKDVECVSGFENPKGIVGLNDGLTSAEMKCEDVEKNGVAVEKVCNGYIKRKSVYTKFECITKLSGDVVTNCDYTVTSRQGKEVSSKAKALLG